VAGGLLLGLPQRLLRLSGAAAGAAGCAPAHARAVHDDCLDDKIDVYVIVNLHKAQWRVAQRWLVSGVTMPCATVRARMQMHQKKPQPDDRPTDPQRKALHDE
jgi:hypothetical protein